MTSMFAYICLGSNDLERSAAFYDAVLGTLGYSRCDTSAESETSWTGWLGWGVYENGGAVQDALTRRPAGRVSLDDMASVAGLSRFRFAHAFRHAFGISPYAYHEQVRIAFAHQLIQQGIELSAVACQLGYADQSHMTRHFRRGSFTTPGRLARMSRRPNR